MNSPDYLMALETTHEIWGMLGDSRDWRFLVITSATKEKTLSDLISHWRNALKQFFKL
jgi:hypothetical protein